VTLNQLNQSEPELARRAFLDCCGSRKWADIMTERRPYRDAAAMHNIAEELWSSLGEQDWQEAFAAHPKIGEQKASANWSAAEQSGMMRAAEGTAQSIRRLNEDYERKFGWIFIVCASGKSAEEMLQLLSERIKNDPPREFLLAAAEQLKITHLRLRKLVAE
jgi:2-oxo-4-hydroxy-4-carboxy-5-ureidoimidazoline decarboxylase